MKAGWRNRKLIDEFVAFNKICMEEYKDLVQYWITFNEINVLKLFMDMNPTTTQEDKKRVFTETHHQLLAAAKFISMGHAISADFKIGCMIAGTWYYPLTSDPKDVLLTQKSMQDNFYFFADIMIRGQYPSYSGRIFKDYDLDFNVSEEDSRVLWEGKDDFIATSYYMTSCLTVRAEAEQVGGNLSLGVKNPYLKASEWGWQIDSQGLKYAPFMPSIIATKSLF